MNFCKNHKIRKAKTAGGNSEVADWNLNVIKGQGTGRQFSLYNEFRFIEIRFHIFYYNLG